MSLLLFINLLFLLSADGYSITPNCIVHRHPTYVGQTNLQDLRHFTSIFIFIEENFI